MDSYTIETFLHELIQVIDKYWLVTLITIAGYKTESQWSIIYLLGAIIFGPTNIVYNCCMIVFVIFAIGLKSVQSNKQKKDPPAKVVTEERSNDKQNNSFNEWW